MTASRTEERLLTVPTSVSVVGPAAIAARGHVRLDDVLRNVPGVTMAQEQVSVRGSSGFSYGVGSRVLLLVDGVPLLGPDAESIPFDALPLQMAERIEVVKGPGSALYGSGALGGIVQMITQDAPEAPRTLVTAQGGAYTPVRYRVWRNALDSPVRGFGFLSVAHARPVGRGGFWVAGQLRDEGGYLRLDQRRRALLYGKATFHPGAWTARVLGGLSFAKGDNFLYWNGLADPLNPGTLALGGGSTTGSADNQVLRYSLLPSAVRVLSPRTILTLRARLFGASIRPLDPNKRPFGLESATIGLRYGGEAQLVWRAPRGVVTTGASADANLHAHVVLCGRPLPGPAPRGGVRAVGSARHAPPAPHAGPALRRVPHQRGPHRAAPEPQTLGRLRPRPTPAPARLLRRRLPRARRDRALCGRLGLSAARLQPRPPARDEQRRRSRRARRDHAGTLRLTFDAAAFRTDYRRLIEPVFVTEGGKTGFKFTNLTRARVQGVEAGVTMGVPFRGRTLEGGLTYTLLDAQDLGAGPPARLPQPAHAPGPPRRAAHAPASPSAPTTASPPARAAWTPTSRASCPTPTPSRTRTCSTLRAAYTLRYGTVSLLVRNALDHYYVERPAILAPPRSLALQISTAF